MKAPQHGALLLGVGVGEVLGSALCPLWLGMPLAYIGLVTAAVGLATWRGSTGLLGKTPDGRFPLWSLLLFWNWHLLSRFLARFVAPTPRFTAVGPGLYVGAWPDPKDWPHDPAVIDVTCELPRVLEGEAYLCLPTWDRSTPTPAQLDQAVAFADHWQSRGKDVLVHCTQGRGRSVTVATAILASRGLHWHAAQAGIASARPMTRLARVQRQTLASWSAGRQL